MPEGNLLNMIANIMDISEKIDPVSIVGRMYGRGIPNSSLSLLGVGASRESDKWNFDPLSGMRLGIVPINPDFGKLVPSVASRLTQLLRRGESIDGALLRVFPRAVRDKLGKIHIQDVPGQFHGDIEDRIGIGRNVKEENLPDRGFLDALTGRFFAEEEAENILDAVFRIITDGKVIK